MADITLPVGPKALSARPFDTRAAQVRPRQEVGDKRQQNKKRSFRDRRSGEDRRKRTRRGKIEHARIGVERRANVVQGRRIAERRVGVEPTADLGNSNSSIGRFVDEKV